MKTLILGATGFIGTRVCELHSKLNEEALIFKRPDFDLLNEESVRLAFINLSYEPIRVIFLASINRTIDDSDYAFDKNIYMIRNFIKYSKLLNIQGLVYISTVDVYGIPSNNHVDETSLINPTTKYGLSKFCCEQLLRIEKFKFSVAIIRLPGVYGNYDFDCSVIGNFIKSVKSKKAIRVSGSGENLRDYIYVDDVANIISRISKLNFNGTINLVTGESKSINEIIKNVFSVFNLKTEIIYDENTHRFFNLKFNNKILLKIIGNYKFIGLNEGIEKYL